METNRDNKIRIREEFESVLPIEVFHNVWEKIQKRDSVPEFPFQINSLNNVCNGIPRGRVTIVSGRPSHGKSAFMLNCAIHLARLGKKIIFLSLEDDKEQIVERMISIILKYENSKLQKGDISGINKLTVMENLNKINFQIVDGFGFNIAELDRTLSTIEKHIGKQDFIFMDYIQMIDNPKYEVLNDFMHDVKKFVLQNNIGFVLGSQQNRQNDDEPTNAGMKGSGGIEETADLILLLNYPVKSGERGEIKFAELSNKDKKFYINDTNSMKEIFRSYFEIIVSKNKRGLAPVKIQCAYYGNIFTFEDWNDPSEVLSKIRFGHNVKQKIERGLFDE
jgi:replicative DNA helicase